MHPRTKIIIMARIGRKAQLGLSTLPSLLFRVKVTGNIIEASWLVFIE